MPSTTPLLPVSGAIYLLRSPKLVVSSQQLVIFVRNFLTPSTRVYLKTEINLLIKQQIEWKDVHTFKVLDFRVSKKGKGCKVSDESGTTQWISTNKLTLSGRVFDRSLDDDLSIS